jgi:hypothetical protein
MADAKEMKMAFDYSYINDTDRVVTFPAGTIVSGADLKRVQSAQPSWLIGVKDDMPEFDDKGDIKMGAIRLTADEKPAKPQDEDPKDPDTLAKKKL